MCCPAPRGRAPLGQWELVGGAGEGGRPQVLGGWFRVGLGAWCDLGLVGS